MRHESQPNILLVGKSDFAGRLCFAAINQNLSAFCDVATIQASNLGYMAAHCADFNLAVDVAQWDRHCCHCS